MPRAKPRLYQTCYSKISIITDMSRNNNLLELRRKQLTDQEMQIDLSAASLSFMFDTHKDSYINGSRNGYQRRHFMSRELSTKE